MSNAWTEKQKKIYAGLKEIGGEAAGYFQSALTYYYDTTLPNRVSHLAHDAREIDGGLRDIFSPETLKKRQEQNLILRGIEKIFGSDAVTYKGHIASILVALDVDEKDALAQEWISVATKFAKYAHRHGIWKEARTFEEFQPLWDRYENVLLTLVGSFYAVIGRIERLISLEHISTASVGALVNLIKSKPYEDYFFKKVSNLNWFHPLKEERIFDPNRIQFDEKGNAFFWSVLDYLEVVAEQTVQRPEFGKELIGIIDDVVRFSREETKINNYHIWWYCVKILNNLPASVITAELPVDVFREWLITWTDPLQGSDPTIRDIGEKLLGKFLGDDATLDYAGAIVDVITRIKPSGSQQPLSKKDEASLLWNSYWILSAFKKYGDGVGAKCSMATIYGIVDKLKCALEYKQKDNHIHIELGEVMYRVTVSRIPLDDLKDGEIGFKENWYQGFVKQFSPEQFKDIDAENDFFALHNTEPQNELKQFIFEAATKEDFISKVKNNLPAGVDWFIADRFEKKLDLLFDGLHADYSHIWFKSLAGGGSNHIDDAEEVLTFILRDVLLAKCRANPEAGREILNSFLSEKYRFPIFKRLVLFCAEKCWDNYADLLERFFETVPDALSESDYEVELFDILHNHNRDFSLSFKARLKTFIDDVPEYYLKEGEKPTAYWKYKWLSPLKDNQDFRDAYNEVKEKAQPKGGEDYEPNRSGFEGGLVVHKSPLSKEDILSKSVLELVKYLNEFQGADRWHGAFEGEPDREGLADSLQAAIKENPHKFTNEIELFHGADYFYVHRLLWGLKDAWNENKVVDWEKIFDFSLKYLTRGKDAFLEDALRAQGDDSGKGKYIYVIEDIVNLIADGSRNDERAFDPKYFDKVEQIFDAVQPFLKGDKQPDTQRDALTYALNTTLGRTIMSYISFSLRVARATQSRMTDWGKLKYERFFNIGIEAFIWFGSYLPNLRYLDQTYADQKIASFAEKSSDDIEWQMFMEGYLGRSQIYEDLYFLMRPHYLKLLEHADFGDRAEKRYVQHIAVGYLQRWELLQPNNEHGEVSLFYKMLADADTPEKRDRWLEVVSFFWSHTRRTIKKEEQEGEKETPGEVKNKIIEFWAWTYDNRAFVQSCLGDKYNSFLGRLAELTILLDAIDENTENWLLLSAPHIGHEHRSPFFVEYLTKFQDEESIKRIGKIYLKILENTTPTYKQEDIQLIVKRLYDLAKKRNLPEIYADADSICNTYGLSGIHFLKDLWGQHQQK